MVITPCSVQRAHIPALRRETKKGDKLDPGQWQRNGLYLVWK